MSWSLDARIPVSFLSDQAALAGVLAVGKPAAIVSLAPPGPTPQGSVAAVCFEAGVMVHPVACACCQGARSPAAQALDGLFQARARGASPWFDRVLVLAEAGDEVRAALREDSMAAARFRMIPSS